MDRIVVHWLMKNDCEKLTALQCKPLCSRCYIINAIILQTVVNVIAFIQANETIAVASGMIQSLFENHFK